MLNRIPKEIGSLLDFAAWLQARENWEKDVWSCCKKTQEKSGGKSELSEGYKDVAGLEKHENGGKMRNVGGIRMKLRARFSEKMPEQKGA